MKRTIEIIVQPDGQIAIEAMGFAGPDCEKATAFLEQALGVATDRRFPSNVVEIDVKP